MSCYKSYGRENRFDPVTFKKEFRGAIHPSKVIVLFCSLSDSLKRTRTSFSKPIKINPKKGNFYFLANIFPVNLFSTCSNLRWVSKLIVLFFSVCCSLIDLAPLSLIKMIDRKNVFSIFGEIFRWVSKVIVLFCSLCDFAERPRASLSQPIKIKTKNNCQFLPSIFPALKAGQSTLWLTWHLTGLFECLHVLQLATLVTMVLGWQLLLNFARKRSNHLILFLYFQAKLTCPCCNTRKKDAILTKCFHVFCFECLKTRYDTRQRKCPKCNATFGNNDFHKIYL